MPRVPGSEGLPGPIDVPALSQAERLAVRSMKRGPLDPPMFRGSFSGECAPLLNARELRLWMSLRRPRCHTRHRFDAYDGSVAAILSDPRVAAAGSDHELVQAHLSPSPTRAELWPAEHPQAD